MTTQLTASDAAEFDAAIADISSGTDSAPDTPYTITLSAGITLGDLTLDVPAGSTVDIEGSGFLVVSSGDSFTVSGALTLDAPFTGDLALIDGQVTIDPVTSAGGIQGGGTLSGTITGFTLTDAVTNYGAIATGALVVVHLTGGTLTNEAGGSIDGATYGVAFDSGGSLTNAGTISGGFVGVNFATSGTVENTTAGAVISGDQDAVVIDGDATVVNGGTIASTVSDAVLALSGTVTNGSATDTTATIQTQGYNAVEIDGSGTVGNDGSIVSTDLAGVYLGSGEVDNGVDASTARIQGAEFGVLVTSGSGTVENDGSILLSGTPSQSGSEIAVALEDGGTVVNGPASATATATATITGVDFGISILSATGTVDNTGSITGTVAVDLEAGGTVVNGPAAGLCTISRTLYGVRVIGSADTASVTNAGSISGQVGVDFFTDGGAATGTLVDGGSIVSTEGSTGTAVRFGDGAERLVLESGYAITGIVQGGGAAGDVTTLELGDGTSGGFTGVSGGSGGITGAFTFQDIGDIDIDHGAAWSFSGTEGVAALQIGGTAQGGGDLTGASLVDDTGGLQLGADATLDLGAAAGSGNTITLAAGATLKIDQAAQFGTGQGTAAYAGDVIAGFVQGDFIDLADVAFTTASIQGYDAATHVLQITDGTHTADLTFAAATLVLPSAFSLHTDGNGGTLLESVACYCAGTLIATPGGERPVERLAIGDLVLTADGRAEPGRGSGRRSSAGRFLTGRRNLLPIRIAAGALGGSLPRRDLLVSPCHAMLLDGMLVPAASLVDGLGITQVTAMGRVDYLHVELDRHDAVLAEGAPSETFLDDDSRMMFHNAAEHAVLFPGATGHGPPVWCAPRVSHGYALEALRRRLAKLYRRAA